MQRVGGEVGGVELARRQAAELVRDVRGRNPRGVEHAFPLGEYETGAARSECRAAAFGVEGDGGEPSVLDAHGDAHDVAARGAAGAADERAVRNVTAPARLAQMLLEGMHPTESR